MTRASAIALAEQALSSRRFATDLARRVAQQTYAAAGAGVMEAYLANDIIPALQALGCDIQLFTVADAPGPILVAHRHEGEHLPTVLSYGHGDVVEGIAPRWSAGLQPFELQLKDEAFFGRGTADNKGQHSILLEALAAVIATRGALGFNFKLLFEMGEESGSPGLAAFCAEHAQLLAADMLIASDGPRIGRDQPTIFLGARGALDLFLEVDAREGFYHSGNWGGLLANPGVILAHAVAQLIGPKGECLLPALTPGAIPEDVRKALRAAKIETAPGDPAIDHGWGAAGLSAEERLYGWSTLELLEFECGNLAAPLNAIPPKAKARLQLRFPVGVEIAAIAPAIRAALDGAGLQAVALRLDLDGMFAASRSDLADPWVDAVARSIAASLGQPPVILPNLGGSLPNAIFTDGLGLPTIWVPHSYPGCGQHGGDEHLPLAIVLDGLRMMTGIFWDLGERSA